MYYTTLVDLIEVRKKKTGTKESINFYISYLDESKERNRTYHKTLFLQILGRYLFLEELLCRKRNATSIVTAFLFPEATVLYPGWVLLTRLFLDCDKELIIDSFRNCVIATETYCVLCVSLVSMLTFVSPLNILVAAPLYYHFCFLPHRSLPGISM